MSKRKKQPEPSIEPLVLSRKNACKALGGISLRTLAYLLAQGRIKYRKIGGRTMIPVAELKRYVAQGDPEPIVPQR